MNTKNILNTLKVSYIYTICMFLFLNGISAQTTAKQDFLNTELPLETRVNDLVSKMTLKEKIGQLSHLTPAIERLGVIAYDLIKEYPLLEGDYLFKKEIETYYNNDLESDLQNTIPLCFDGGYCNEALHGITRSGVATVFPQVIGLGSTFNPALIQKISTAISDEARIHNQIYNRKLTYWSPTINMLRDPRWGRNEESYSEDPYLQSRMAVSFIKGLQGDDPNHLKTVSTVKHFVANNSEFNRHDGSSNMPERQLREYYFPAFKAAVQEGNVQSVMSAYNAVNGVPVSANSWLLNTVLRKEWGFEGFVVSDCGAISDIINGHKYEIDKEKAVALAVKSGTDLECESCETEQFLYDKFLFSAHEKGYISEKEIDTAIKRIFTARFKLGEFDPKENDPYRNIPITNLDSEANRELSLQAARESMILLKNENNLLPFNASKLKKVAVIGPNADVAETGGYSGHPTFKISPLSGIREKIGYKKTHFQPGSRIQKAFPSGLENAIKAAKEADVAVVVLGTNLTFANESKDRKDIGLPEAQIELLKAVYKANPNVVLVLMNGMSLDISWAYDTIPAIIEAWYPGQLGGIAIADVLFGDYNPAGRLPVTFYKDVSQLEPIDEYDLTKGNGRTYWYFKGDVAFPFGHGLSYTTFKYDALNVNTKFNTKKDKNLKVSFDIKNTGDLDGDEVVQLYVRDVKSKFMQPKRKLRKFKRVHIAKNQTASVAFTLSKDDFAFWNPDKKKWAVEKGDFEILIGSSSEAIKSSKIIAVR